LIDIGYSQIELRTMAHDAKEGNFLKVFEEDGDPHQLTADLAGVERHIGKTLNFSWAYGAGPRKLADTIEKGGNERSDEKDTRAWLDQFNGAYPTLVNWKKVVIRRARELGYVPTYGGRRRHLPDLNSPDHMLRGAAERQCVNSRIQGSCADMLKWAMLQLEPYCDWYGVKMIAQVHDELLFEVPNEVAKEFVAVAQKVMESIKEEFSLNVKILAEPGYGSTWAEAK
jgi:DNA polymerase-1